MNTLDSRDLLLAELADQIVDTSFGLTEDDDTRCAMLRLQRSQQLDKADILDFLGQREDILFDVGVRCHFLLADLDHNWLLDVVAVRPCKRLDFLWPSGAEHECLAIGADVPHNTPQLLLEAHILVDQKNQGEARTL